MEPTAPDTPDTFQQWWEDWKKRLAKKRVEHNEADKSNKPKIKIFEEKKSRTA